MSRRATVGEYRPPSKDTRSRLTKALGEVAEDSLARRAQGLEGEGVARVGHAGLGALLRGDDPGTPATPARRTKARKLLCGAVPIPDTLWAELAEALGYTPGGLLRAVADRLGGRTASDAAGLERVTPEPATLPPGAVIGECAWCGAEIESDPKPPPRSRSGEIFCSRAHRDASTRAVKRLRERCEVGS